MKQIGVASRQDVGRIVEMMVAYGEEKEVPYEVSSIRNHVEDILASPNSIMLTSIHNVGELEIISGFISIELIDNPFLPQKIAIKTHWLIDKKYPSRGRDLLKAAEHWAKLQGADSFIVPMPDLGVETTADIMMVRSGYKPIAREYKKELR